MIPAKYQGTMYVLLAAAGYSTVAISGKWMQLLNIPIFAALSWRFGGAALIFWLCLQWQKMPALPWNKKLSCFLLGFFGDASRSGFFFMSVVYIGASLSALLLYTFPFFVFLLQRFIFNNRATSLQWIALFFSFIGCILAIDPFHATIHIDHWYGLLFGIGAGIAEACYLTFGAHFTKGIPTLQATTYLTRGTFVCFILLAFFAGQMAIPVSTAEWTMASFSIVVTAIFPLFCLIKGLQLVGATTTSLLFTIEPVLTILLAILLFGEPFTLFKVIGSVCIIGSAFLIQASQMLKAKKQTQLAN